MRQFEKVENMRNTHKRYDIEGKRTATSTNLVPVSGTHISSNLILAHILHSLPITQTTWQGKPPEDSAILQVDNPRGQPDASHSPGRSSAETVRFSSQLPAASNGRTMWIRSLGFPSPFAGSPAFEQEILG